MNPTLPLYPHTDGHLNCPACDLTRRRIQHAELAPSLPFGRAASLWIDSRTFRDARGRARYVKPLTLKAYAGYIGALNRFFKDLPLDQIHAGHLREYQEQRISGRLSPDPDAPREVSPNKVNQELSTMQRILRRANLWRTELAAVYEPLQREENDIPRALTPEEQEHFLRIAASKPRWETVYWYSVVALRTSASNVELRQLRLGDVDLYAGVLYIQPRGAKNRHRIRTIPLAPDAHWAFERLKQQAAEHGAHQPQHYVFPYRRGRGEWNPDQAMSNSGLKKPWEQVRTSAGLPHFQIHGWRHTAITRLAEAGTPVSVILSMAGHVSQRMQLHYTHISEAAQRKATEAAYRGEIYGRKKPPKPAFQQRAENSA
jgi:integrase